MERIRNLVDGVRTKIRGLYDSPVGNLLPTRQVLGAGLAGLLATFADELIPGLEVSDALIGGVAALAVAWLLGPPKVGEPETFQLVPKGHVVGLTIDENFETVAAEAETVLERHPGSATLDRSRSASGATSLPDVEGEFVGPEDDDTEPGRVGFS